MDKNSNFKLIYQNKQIIYVKIHQTLKLYGKVIGWFRIWAMWMWESRWVMTKKVHSYFLPLVKLTSYDVVNVDANSMNITKMVLFNFIKET